MIKLIYLFVFLWTGASLASGVRNNTGWYIAGSVSMITDTEHAVKTNGDWHYIQNRIGPFDNLAYRVTLGYEFEDNIRLELDVLSTVIRSGNVNERAINYDAGVESTRLLYDIDLGLDYRVNPYIGGAVYGISLNDRLDYDIGAIIGFSFRISQRMSADFEYQRNWYRVIGVDIITPTGHYADATVKNGRNHFRIATRTKF